MKKRQFGRDCYDYIIKNYRARIMAELAVDLGMRETTLVHALMVYCLKHDLEIPRLLLERKSDVKVLKRHDANQQIRVSVLRLAQANLGDVTRFKSFVDPDRRIVLVAAEDDVQSESVEDALTELFGITPPPSKPQAYIGGDDSAIIN